MGGKTLHGEVLVFPLTHFNRKFEFMKIVENWRAALTHYSTQALAFGAAIQGVWMAYPDDMKIALGPDAVQMVARATALILALGLVGKFIDQSKDAP